MIQELHDKYGRPTGCWCTVTPIPNTKEWNKFCEELEKC